jgi:hypothetical protein
MASRPLVLRRVGNIAAFFLLTVLPAVVAQSKPTAVPSLEDFFQALVQHYDPANLPKFDELMSVERQVAGMDQKVISKALPSVLAAFGHRDDTVKKYAAAAIYSIGERSDGTALLKPYAKAIGSGLDVSNTDLQGATLQLLAMLKPGPQSEIVPLLVAFVKRADRSPAAQAYAISLLLQIAPENPDLIPALQNFAARPMDQETKDALINGIANSSTENVIATDVLIGALEDPTEGVRFQAAQAFQRMPNDMVLRAKPALQKAIERPDEAQEVKAAAREALRMINREQ